MLLDQRPGFVPVGGFDDVIAIRINSCLHQHAHAWLVVGNKHGVRAASRGSMVGAQGRGWPDARAAATNSAASFAAPECFFHTATTPAVRRARVSVASSSLIVTTTTGTSLL